MPKHSKEHYVEKNRQERKLDKELGIRYRAWEHMPGESYTEFKRRFKADKKKALGI